MNENTDFWIIFILLMVGFGAGFVVGGIIGLHHIEKLSISKYEDED